MANDKDPLATAVDSATATSAPTDFRSFITSMGLPTGEQVSKERQQAFEAYKQRRSGLMAEQDRLTKMMGDVSASMAKIQAPKAPNLEDIPTPPDSQYRDPTQALGSLASVLAVVGSMKTRAPLTAALNAAASSMAGFHAGDQERVKLERQKWKDNLYKGLQQNQLEMQRYMNALQEANFDMQKAQQAFRMIAAENDHVSMKMAIEAGDYTAQMAILDAGLKANQEAAKLWLTDQEKQAQIEATKAYREATLQARGGDKSRAESFKIRSEYQKRIGPIDKEISGLDSAESLLRGATPGEKILGARSLQHLIGGSNRLKLDASQMQNFGDIVTRIEGWASKGIWGELTDDQYQQLLSGIKSLREKEQARRKAVEDDTRNVVKAGNLDTGIVFGEESEPSAEPSTPPSTPPAPGGGKKTLDDFLGKPRSEADGQKKVLLAEGASDIPSAAAGSFGRGDDPQPTPTQQHQAYLDHVNARGEGAIKAFKSGKHKEWYSYDDLKRYVDVFGGPAEDDVRAAFGEDFLRKLNKRPYDRP